GRAPRGLARSGFGERLDEIGQHLTRERDLHAAGVRGLRAQPRPARPSEPVALHVDLQVDAVHARGDPALRAHAAQRSRELGQVERHANAAATWRAAPPPPPAPVPPPAPPTPPAPAAAP